MTEEIVCHICKKRLPRTSFPEYNLRKHWIVCRECSNKKAREYNIKHNIKVGIYKNTKIREHERKDDLLSNPYEEIFQVIQRFVEERADYQDKGNNACGYCDEQAVVRDVNRKKNLCWKHFLIECLTLGKPFKKEDDTWREIEDRELRILEQLSKLGVEVRLE